MDSRLTLPTQALLLVFVGFFNIKKLSRTALFQITFAQTQHFLHTFLHALVRQQTATHTISPRDSLIISLETQQRIFPTYYLRSSRPAF